MFTMEKFAGINNVLPPEQIKPAELAQAINVDVDIDGSIWRRGGFAQASATQHANVWEAPAGFTLATRGGPGDLVNVTTNTVLLASLGHARLWFAVLPDGRIAFSNGTTKGAVAADGSAAGAWGVPIPATAGVGADTGGNLLPGAYQWGITYQRLADGAEGGPAYGGPLQVASGGVALTGLPTLAGHRINLYLTSANGTRGFFAGYTAGSSITFAGRNKDLTVACRTEFLRPPPIGKLLAVWRNRPLVAVDRTLYASMPFSAELFNLRADYKLFDAPITMVQPVGSGIWVGTTHELAFLDGPAWDQLARHVKMPGAVVLGSGCRVPGAYLKGAAKGAPGDAMVCIADGWLVGGNDQGELVPLSVQRYRTAATEVAATFRLRNGLPQYIACVQ